MESGDARVEKTDLHLHVSQAKKFVESVPKVLKENLPKEEADQLQKTLEALGATVTLS